MNQRIKQIRQHPKINLSQDAFGKKIGVTAAAISRLESGERNITDKIIISICRDFGVDEHWLRTGEGEMFVHKSMDEQISAFIGDALKDESDSFKRRFIAMLASLDESDWDVLLKMAQRMTKERD